MNDEVLNEPKRGPGRPRIQREATRAEPVRQIARAPEGLVRNRKGHVDALELPAEVVHMFQDAGYTIEWKRFSVLNEQDPSYQVHLAENAWEPVTTEEVSGYMPKGYEGAIIRDGLQLMKRPAYLTDEARREDMVAARRAIRVKEQQLGQAPNGTMTRDHQGVRPQIGRSYEPIPVPSD